ncbi:MAG: ROK family transcriptional regulator [Chloroflexota bacterium]
MRLETKATHQQTRAFNEGLVLRRLYDLGPISRAEVARLTGLTRTTVSEIVAEEIAAGLVEEVGRGPSIGGKAPILLQVVADARLVLALDLGEQAFAGALVDLRGEIRRRISIPVEGRDGRAAIDAVERLVDELRAAAGRRPLLGIGVGTPGIVDTESGTIRWAVNLEWQDLPLGDLLRERTGLPAYVANDSRAAAMGEHLFDTERRSPNLVAIKIGHGIGAGIVLGGELYQGDGFGAGEIGHTAAVDGGDACRCGRSGCLETVAGSRAILAAAARAAVGDPGGLLGRRIAERGTLTIADVRDAVDAGDEAARRVVVAAGRWLGRAIAGLIGALDVHHVVLLGTVTMLGDPWLGAVREEALRGALELLTRDTEIDIGGAPDDVVLLGASALLISRELGLVPAR